MEENTTLKHTALTAIHQKAGAKMVPFAGYLMPVQYTGINDEHETVRNAVGMFDVSHMGEFILKGDDALDLLQRVTSNDASKLSAGKAQYSYFPNETGGIIDDLIVYHVNESFFRLVINAGTREKDLAWMRSQATGFSVELTERTDLAMLAVQGPDVKNIIARFLPGEKADTLLNLKPFHFIESINSSDTVFKSMFTISTGLISVLPNNFITTPYST